VSVHPVPPFQFLVSGQTGDVPETALGKVCPLLRHNRILTTALSAARQSNSAASRYSLTTDSSNADTCSPDCRQCRIPYRATRPTTNRLVKLTAGDIQRMRVPSVGFGIALLALLPQCQMLSAAESCEKLSSLVLPNTTITSARVIPAGDFTQPATGTTEELRVENVPAFCRIAATVKPSPDSDIKIEVWAPVDGWNGNLEAVGNGGFAGRLFYDDMATALRRGYATAATDTGHVGNNGAWALGHQERVVDFGYRAIHEMTVQAKALVEAYYGRGPQKSYFTGCSTGGRQALMEAQRFPADYDGIIAGAPVNFATHVAVAQLWNASTMLRNPASGISQHQLEAINRAVLAACDGQDGVTDGLISNPTRCRFDPKTLRCQGAATETCLTDAQVEAARQIYGGVKNPRTGREIFPPLMRGSEQEWLALTSFPLMISTELFKYLVFEDPNWDWRGFDFDAGVAKTDAKLALLLNAADPDLKEFKKHGGKIIMWHGWNDPSVSPLNSVNYHASISHVFGANQTDGFFRLFMAPGTNHCGGGPGPNDFDALTALEQWVEQGKPPETLIASHTTNGVVDRARPLCPYPQVAQYKGNGNTDDAKSFVCKVN
jgi:feruloyl esterase